MIVSLIVAISKNYVIGKDQQMPWHLPKDVKRFKDVTSHHPIILGRKNYESMGSALPNRTSLVISKNPQYTLPDANVFQTIEDAIEYAQKNPQLQQHNLTEHEIFIIGGGEIYKYALTNNLVEKVYITILDKEIQNGTVFFPKFDFSSWNLIDESENLFSNNISYQDFVYQKK